MALERVCVPNKGCVCVPDKCVCAPDNGCVCTTKGVIVLNNVCVCPTMTGYAQDRLGT